MPVLAPRTRFSGGFTLIEILIVMVLIAVLTAAAMTTINYAIRDDDAETEARRIAALIRLAAEEALLTGREYGMRIEDERLRFFVFDDETGQWQPLQDDNTFRPRKLSPTLDIDLVLEGQGVVLGQENEENDEDETQGPQLMFLSSGEITPFTLALSEFDGERWTIEGDLLGRLELLEPRR